MWLFDVFHPINNFWKRLLESARKNNINVSNSYSLSAEDYEKLISDFSNKNLYDAANNIILYTLTSKYQYESGLKQHAFKDSLRDICSSVYFYSLQEHAQKIGDYDFTNRMINKEREKRDNILDKIFGEEE